MKKIRLAIVLVLVMALSVFAGCAKTPVNPDKDPDPITPPYEKTEGVYTYHEMTEWGSSAAAGKAVQDGEYTKIVSTTSAYGGIISSNNTADAVMIDFSKPAYLNFKDFSASEQVSMIFKMRVVGYNLADTSYIISDDFKGIAGDFSINLQDAIKYYGGAATNAELIYKVGDEDLDDETGIKKIEVGDKRIGELKFANVTKKIKCITEIWCFGNGGANATNDFIKMKSFSITNENEKTVSSININQTDLTNENAKIKGSESITLAPTIEKSAKASGKVIYSSTNMDRVPVTEAGVVSFVKVTSENVKIKIVSRDDISKTSSFYVGVIINLNNAADVKSHLDDLVFTSNLANVDDVTTDILAGSILTPQIVEYKSGNLKAIRGFDNANVVTILNQFSSSNTEMTSELSTTGGEYKLSVTLPKGELTWENAKLSCYNVGSTTITRLSDNVAVALDGDKFISEIKLPYAKDNAKITEKSTIIVVWSNGTAVVASRVEVDNKDISKVDSEYKGANIEGFFAPVGDLCGTSTLNSDSQLVLKIDKSRFYMNMVTKAFSYTAETGKDMMMLIDIASMDKTTYSNVLFGGAYVLTSQILNNNGQALWCINLSKIIKQASTENIVMNFDFLLNNGNIIGGEQEVIINSVTLYC